MDSIFILIGIILSLIIFTLIYEGHTHALLIQDLSKPVFALGLMGTIIFMVWVFQRHKGVTAAEKFRSERMEMATKHAFVALIIAYLAHLDLVFLSFIVVFLFVYYATSWV